MSAEATALILGLTDADQAEYAAAAHKTPAPEPEGEASTGAGQTPAADVEGASASGAQAEQLVTVPAIANTRAPRWASVDDETADLLTLVAEQHPATPSEVEEWEHFKKVLAKVAAENDGLIDQNRTRPLFRGEIKPQRVGAFFSRAARWGLIRPSGDSTTSDDRHGKNTGKPARVWVWLGAAS